MTKLFGVMVMKIVSEGRYDKYPNVVGIDVD
jgi:hypothetical protein